ncbi:MAG: COX15/CtaA family protein [Acidobacteriota bacterium]
MRKWFAAYAWLVLAFTLLVILWGAYVRATGSGAGCGSHWPLCNGEVIPRAAELATFIEFTHRATSGLALLLVLGLLSAFRLFPRGSPVRTGAVFSVVLIFIEALIGAGLVLFELVAQNASIARAVSIAAHLVNTFLLLAALTLTAWWASGKSGLSLRRQGLISWILGLAFVALLALGATGAVSALGDTLFPARSLAEGVQQDFSPTAHFLIRLRVIHPTLAIIIGGYLLFAAWFVYTLRRRPETRIFSHLVALLVVIQIIVGSINIALLAPVWIQLLHLLLADLLWISVVLLAAAALAKQVRASSLITRSHGMLDFRLFR